MSKSPIQPGRPLEVIVLNDYGFAGGGSSQVALAQAQGLAKLGHAVSFVCAMPSSMGLDVPVDIPGIKRVYCTAQWDLVSNPNKAGAFLQGLWNRSVTHALRRVFQETPAVNRILLVNSFSKALSASFLPVAEDHSVPVVVVAHDYFLWCPNGAWHNYRTGQPCALKPLSVACLATNCDKRNYAQKTWRGLRQSIYRRAGLPEKLSGIVFVSEFSRQLAHAMGAVAATEYVLPLPVADHEQKIDVESNARFLFVGRLDVDKGALLLAQAAQSLNAPVTFVGDGEERDRIRSLLPQAEITGWLPTDAVRHHLSTARVLVIPTILRESFGLTAYEAASMGVPSIVAGDTAPAQFVEHDVSGLVFERGSVDSLRQQMARVMSGTRLVRRLGDKARSKFESVDRGTDVYCMKLATILYEVLSGVTQHRVDMSEALPK